MTRREWKLAIPILLALGLCLAGFLRGVQVENSYSGMSAMRALPDGKLALVANGALHVLDAQGTRLARQPIGALGLGEDPNDMDWTVDAQGRIEAWFFDDSVPRIVRCAWDAAQARLGGCGAVMSGAQLKSNPKSRAVHLAVDRTGERVFVADAAGHRVNVFDLKGKRVQASERDKVSLYFPNRLRYLGNDTLVVADNDHKRLAWLRVAPRQPPAMLRTLESSLHPQVRSSRTKVTDVAFGPSGAVWMLAMKQGQKDGDVLVFRGERPVARAELPPGADPLIIEALGDAAVIADYSLVKLYRVGATGQYLGEFGDAALARELAPLQARSREASWWTTGSLAAAGVIVVIGLLVGWRYGEKPAARGEGPPTPMAEPLGDDDLPLRYPVVLPQTPAYLAALRRMGLGLGLVVLLMLGMLAFVAWNVKPGGRIYLQMGVALLVAVLMAASTVRDVFRPRELRITAHRVGIFRGGKPEAQALLAEVRASRKALLIGRVTIVYRLTNPQLGKIPPMFDLALLDRVLLSRLPTANLLDDRRMEMARLKRQPVLVALLAATLGVTAWLAYRTLWG
ncbi:MAG TPA: hypothetical protein VLI46_02415 [Ramlibacter sp.]|nr:hypothetical protein [Ramlibacter sp.]